MSTLQGVGAWARVRSTLQDPKPWPKPWTYKWPWWGALVGFSLGPRHHRGLVVPWWDLALAQGTTKAHQGLAQGTGQGLVVPW